MAVQTDGTVKKDETALERELEQLRVMLRGLVDSDREVRETKRKRKNSPTRKNREEAAEAASAHAAAWRVVEEWRDREHLLAGAQREDLGEELEP